MFASTLLAISIVVVAVLPENYGQIYKMPCKPTPWRCSPYILHNWASMLKSVTECQTKCRASGEKSGYCRIEPKYCAIQGTFCHCK